MSDDVKLEPCPFCGSKATKELSLSKHRTEVFCSECECGTYARLKEAEAITAWNTRTAANADVDRLVDAGRTLIAQMSGTYKARNGKQMSIEADDGEKCWIVHSDDIVTLEAALAAFKNKDQK